jgi:glucokinase
LRRAILVNGVPASGKSTVSARLVPMLEEAGIPAVPLSLDTVKEALFAHLGTGDREENRRLGRASYQAIFDSIAAFPDSLVPVVDAWHGFQPPEVLRGHLERARIDHVVEVWCRVAPETAAARYRARARHPGHPPASYADELRALAGRARPMGFGPVVEIDSDGPPDPAVMANIIRRLGAGEAN